MNKLVSHDDGVLTYDVLNRWKRGGHEVALMRLTNNESPGEGESYLMCECDFDVEDSIVDGKVVGKIRKNDPHKCKAKKAVRGIIMRLARKKSFDRWRRMGLKKAILDIHRRVQQDEFFGQCMSGCVYTQEVAKLLDRTHEDVLEACNKLYAEERLQLDGRILTDYEPCFRFPLEMTAIMGYLVEEPLGWPNGDAGSGWVSALEADVQGRLGFKSGKTAFGQHWPSIDPHILMDYALEPVAKTLRWFANVRPNRPYQGEDVGALTDFCVGIPILDMRLRAVASDQPEIDPRAFREFVRALLRLSFERVDIYRQWGDKDAVPERTLHEMAEYFDKVAANFREKNPKK